MRIDETTYHEYVSWKLENKEFVDKLENQAGDVFYRFKHVVDVVEYLYNSLVDDEDYGEQEDVIFKTGYYYIVNQIDKIKDLLEKYYNNDLSVLNKHASEVNLLLNTFDFQLEVLNHDQNENDKLKELLMYDSKIIEYINKGTVIPEYVYLELDALVTLVYEELEIDFYPLNNIFLEIADELNIL